MDTEVQFKEGEYCSVCDTLRSLHGPCQHQKNHKNSSIQKEQQVESLSKSEFIDWVADRFIHVHKEDSNFDFIIGLRAHADWLRIQEKKEPPADTLSNIQREVGIWSEQQFGTDNLSKNPEFKDEKLRDLPSLLGMIEEVGELVAPIVKLHQGRFKGTVNKAREDIKDALGDMLIFMCDFAYRNDINLSDILRQTWDKVKNRKQSSWNEDKAKENQDQTELLAMSMGKLDDEIYRCRTCGKDVMYNAVRGAWVHSFDRTMMCHKADGKNHTFSNIVPVAQPSKQQTGQGWAETVDSADEGMLVVETEQEIDEPNIGGLPIAEIQTQFDVCKCCGGKVFKEYNKPWKHIDKADNHIPTPTESIGFNVARQIAGWLDGQMRTQAEKLIDQQERKAKFIKALGE